MNFDKYKNRLIEYLQLKDIKAQRGLIRCFNPNHEDKKPSCELFDDHFICYSGKCGIHGDIYDAVEILEGITDKAEQYKAIERTFGNNYTPSTLTVKTEERFISDPSACAALEKYLLENPSAEKNIKIFLSDRAHASGGKQSLYPSGIKDNLVKYFFYWPGIDIARAEIGTDVLRNAGVPLTNPKTGYSSWQHSGVIIKLGSGYKLHYYQNGTCEKRGTKSCSTFPMPGAIDTSKPVVLVEGEMDALSCAAAGIANVFSCGGTNGLTAPKIKQHLLQVPEIILFFDNDSAGRKAAGLEAFAEDDKRQTNIPEIILKAGYTGKIKIAVFPEKFLYKDQDAAIIAGKIDVVKKAIEDAKEYTPPIKNKKPNGNFWEAYDTVSIKRIQGLLKKIPLEILDDKDIEPFVFACRKACGHSQIKQELAKWGAAPELLEKENDTTPYFLIEACEKYGVSKYLRKEIEKALIPESEILKKIKLQKTIVDIDFAAIETNDNALQFLTTKGVRSAAQLVADVLKGKMIYVEAEKKHYFFNGHVWTREPDVAGISYIILCNILRHFLKKRIGNKGEIYELLQKIEGRRFRVELVQDFSGLKPEVFRESVLFDGPTVKESLTLLDGVMDFSGNKIVFRKSEPEEYRRELLPYKIESVEKALNPDKFLEFMKSNFKNEETLQTLMYYLSLIPSRNTQYKYGGIFIGKTHTGKTTTIELLKDIYINMLERLPSDVLVSQNRRRLSGNEATPYIARLEGKGAAIAQETERNGYLNNALWKELTGGDTLTARGLYKEPHDFIPTSQIIMCTNHSPRFDAHDEATIDRMIVIPFSVQHKKGEKGTKSLSTILKSIKEEYPAIIKYFAQTYIDLKYNYEGAIPLSEECKNYKQNYVKEQETDLDKFVNDNLEFDMSGSAFEKVQTVYERYLTYYNLSADDKEALTRNKFVRYLKHDYLEINYKQKKIDGNPELCFFNIRLKPFEGKTEQPALKDSSKNDNRTGINNYDNYEVPPDENPFE